MDFENEGPQVRFRFCVIVVAQLEPQDKGQDDGAMNSMPRNDRSINMRSYLVVHSLQ